MYYHDEIRAFDEVSQDGQASAAELKLAAQLIESISNTTFAAQAYQDKYRERVLGLIDEKSKGKAITLHPKAPAPVTEVVDLVQRLKDSLAQAGTKRPQRSRAMPATRAPQPATKKTATGRR